MWFDYAQVDETPAPCAATVRKIITVQADAGYDVTATGRIVSRWVALRTASGAGWLAERSGPRHELAAGSLLVLPWAEIARFATGGKRWRFWWMEFDVAGALPLEAGRVHGVPMDRGEEETWTGMFNRLRSARVADRRVASAEAGVLLQRWAAAGGADLPERRSAKERAVEQAVEAMRRTLDRPSSVADWAAASGYGVKRFCQVFREVMGVPPKRHYDRMRLQHAAELMRHGGLNVSQTADRLGFSSPFHLSRAFSRHLGKSPRLWLQGR